MADVIVQVAQATKNGVELPAAVTTVVGNVYHITDNDGNVLLQVTNPGSASYIDVVPTLEAAGYSVANHRVTTPASKTIWVGPFPPFVFGDDVDLVPGAAGLLLVGLRI